MSNKTNILSDTSLDNTLSTEDLHEFITSFNNMISEFISKLSKPTSEIFPYDVINAMDYIEDSIVFKSFSETIPIFKNATESLLILTTLIKNHIQTYCITYSISKNDCDNECNYSCGFENTIIHIHSNANEYINDMNSFEQEIKYIL